MRMSDHPSPEALEQLALGELSAAAGAEIEQHARACDACGRELRWMRAEAALVRRRAAPEVAHLWEAIEERVSAPVPLRRARRWALGSIAAAAAAAAAVVFAVRVQAPKPLAAVPAVATAELDVAPPPEAVRAMDVAEGQYKNAFSTLSAEYARARSRLDPRTQQRWDRTVERTGVQLALASDAARGDVNARLRVLDGYAAAVRSLNRALEEAQR
jgi:hypothetical protein